MTVVVYQSTDGSAPTLSGTAGDLVNLLDKILVTGYGSKAAAGWTKPYTGTNKAVFRQGAGCDFYLNVDDAASGTGGAKEALVRGYESMTAQDTGTYPFPTTTQLAAGIVIRKSTTADATTRAWYAIADERTFYLFIASGDSANVYLAFGFGDYYSFVKTDLYNCMIMGRFTQNVTTVTVAVEGLHIGQYGSATATAISGHYMARSYHGLGGSLAFSKTTDYNFAGTNTSGARILAGNLLTYPNPSESGIHLARVRLIESGQAWPKGYLRGYWSWGHAVTSPADRDTFSGSDEMASRTFQIVKASCDSGLHVVETSSTWDTSP